MPEPTYGSDAIAEAIRATGVPYIALTPGASFRGLHDSLVNHLGDQNPQMLLCLHEEHAVAIAHGYTKVAGEPLAVALHSNVGLLHASMAVFNAYADRAPMLIIGADGPSDAARRRPWIDWIHTVSDLGAIVRDFVKWDDRAESAAAAVPMVLRGHQLACTAPTAPVFVSLDVTAQEVLLTEPPPDARALQPIPAPAPDADAVAAAVGALASAERVVILAGRVTRDQRAWDDRVRLAESVNARVITNHKLGGAFPATHPLSAGTPTRFVSAENRELLREADCILSLDWLDLGGTIRQAFGDDPCTATVLHTTLEHNLLSGGGKLHFSTPPVDVFLTCTPDTAVTALLEGLPVNETPSWTPRRVLAPAATDGPLTVTDIQVQLREATTDDDVSLVRVAFGWDFSQWPIEGPLDYLGSESGGGIGSGPGMSVGSALALRGSGRLPVAVLGDGDYLMGVTALWTATKYDVPLLVVVANNHSYFNDEVHQREVARERSRPLENAHLGLRMDDPVPDAAGFARAQGFTAVGPVSSYAELGDALRGGVEVVRGGGRYLVDVSVAPGYGQATVMDFETSD